MFDERDLENSIHDNVGQTGGSANTVFTKKKNSEGNSSSEEQIIDSRLDSQTKTKGQVDIDRATSIMCETFLIHPNNTILSLWNVFISLLLIISCMTTPLHLAFFDKSSFFYDENDTKSPIFWDFFNNVVDLFFLADILVTFNTSYYDNDFVLINNRVEIAKKYIAGWFVIDTVAIMPFDALMGSASFNSLVRLTKIGRLSKLVKLARLLRVLKVMNQKNQINKAEEGFERLVIFTVMSVIFLHIITCMWLIIPQLINEPEDGMTNTWLEAFESEIDTNLQAYTISLYWTVTTITTVGYGDVGITNNVERMFCAVIMLIGVISFSYANGSLSSILTTYDV
jgi:hypothetical protein